MRISDIADESFCRLSGGQKQRALLARALCAADKMLLLDEPVSGLDPKVSARMYDLIDSLNKDDGVTVIMISHDISAAVQYARHILHLGSRDVFFGSVEEYRESPLGMSLFRVRENSLYFRLEKSRKLCYAVYISMIRGVF